MAPTATMNTLTPADTEDTALIATTVAHNEASPLLPKTISHTIRELSDSDVSDDPEIADTRGRQTPHSVLLVLYAIALISDLAGSLQNRPEFNVVQLAICRDYYRSHDPGVIGPAPFRYVDEALCRVDEVQVAVADLRARWSVIERVVQLLLLLPYGSLADVIGRRAILFLGLVGNLLATMWPLAVCYFHEGLSSELLLASPFFLIIGGGDETAHAVFSASIAELVPAEKRTTVFYWLGTMGIISSLIGVPFGSWLMTRDIWLPFQIGIPFSLVTFPLLLLLPDTQSGEFNPKFQPTDEEDTRLTAKAPKYGTVGKISLALGDQGRAILAATQRLGSLLVVIFTTTLASSSNVLLIQFAARILGSVANTGYVQTMATLTTLGVFVTSAFLSGRESARAGAETGLSSNTWTLLFGLAVCTVGELCIGLSQTVVPLVTSLMIKSIGSCYGGALQGTVASLTGEGASATKIFAATSLAGQVAGITGTFMFTKLYGIGLGMRSDFGKALPFVVASALYGIATIMAVWTARRRRARVS